MAVTLCIAAIAHAIWYVHLVDRTNYEWICAEQVRLDGVMLGLSWMIDLMTTDALQPESLDGGY